MSRELVHTEEFDGFTINVYFHPEDESIRDCFDNSVDDIAELEDKVERGIYLWFWAEVVAAKAGIELGVDTLGGCMYESVKDFITESGYYEDMRQSAVDDARDTLVKLAA